MDLKDKIDNAIRILHLAEQAAKQFDHPVELCYSGGKDSDVILHLAIQSGIDFRAIYKNTTIDPPGTIAHVKENNVEIVQPKKTFHELIAKKGLPSFRRRFCCDYLKEYKILEVQVLGVRRDEANKRKNLYKSFEGCRLYKNSKKNHVHQFYPIVDWSDKDVENYIKMNDLKLAKHYYKQNGTIDFHRRLGCIGCPLKSDRGLAELKIYPKFLKKRLEIVKEYYKTHQKQKLKNEYDAMICILFFKDYESFFLAKTGGFLGKDFGFDSKKKLEEIFNIKFD